MNRKEFVRFLALMSVGQTARPEQIAAFEFYYQVNTPNTEQPLIAIDEIFLSGLATYSMPMKVGFFRGDDTLLANLSFNAFGGVIRWAVLPDQRVVIRPVHFNWRFTPHNMTVPNFDKDFTTYVTGHISYIKQGGFRQTVPITKHRGCLE